MIKDLQSVMSKIPLLSLFGKLVHFADWKLFKPLARSYYCSDCPVVIFFQFYRLDALRIDNYSTTVYVLGHKYVLDLSQSHFNPRLAARDWVTLSWARNSLMSANLTFFNSGFLISNMSKTHARDCWRNVDFPYITEQFLITVLPWNKYVIFPSVSHFQHKLLPQMCHGS